MATLVTHTIRESGGGGDYTSVAAWESGEQRNLISADEIEQGLIQGAWTNEDTAGVIINGWTSDVNRYVILEAEGTARHDGKWKATAHRTILTGNPSGVGVVQVDGSQVAELIGLQVELKENTTGSKAAYATNNAAGMRLRLDSCIAVLNNPKADATYAALFLVGSVQIRNCVGYEINHGTNWCKGFGWVDAGEGSYQNLAYNCTAANFLGSGLYSSGFYSHQGSNDDVLIINCLSDGCQGLSFDDRGQAGGWNAASDYNAGDDTDVPDNGNSRTNQTFTFVDEPNDDYHLEIGDLGAAAWGTKMSGAATWPFTIDIDGDTRAHWDIGMDYLPVTVNTSTIKESGGDYSNVTAWEAGEQRNLQTLHEIERGEISGTWAAESTAWETFLSWTTDAVRHIELTAVGDSRAQMPWSNTAYRKVNRNTTGVNRYVFHINHDVWLDGLQIDVANDQDITFVSVFGVYHQSLPNTNGGIAGNFHTDCHLVVDTLQGTSQTFGFIIRPEVYCTNCFVFISRTSGSTRGFSTHTTSGTLGGFYNCTVWGVKQFGFAVTSLGIVARNCLGGGGAGDAFTGSVHADTDYNASDDGTAPGANSKPNQTFTFVSGSDLHLDATDAGAKEFGVDNAAYPTNPYNVDFDGVARHLPWDIGADQFVPGAVVTNTSIVRENGTGDYTSLVAWEAGEQRLLASDPVNEIERAQIEQTWAGVEGRLDINGWSADATRYIEIEAIGNARHGGLWTTDAHRFSVVNLQCVISRYEYTRLIGLQGRQAQTGGGSMSGYLLNAGLHYLEACIAIATHSDAATISDFLFDLRGTGVGGHLLVNCLAIQEDDNNNPGKVTGFYTQHTTGAVSTLYNCTAVGMSVGQTEGYGFWTAANLTTLCVNCLSDVAGDASHLSWRNIYTAASDYNASADGTAPDNGNSRTGQTFTFVDAAGGNYHLSVSDGGAQGFGFDLQAVFTTDIDEQTRTAPWDIGVDQIVILATPDTVWFDLYVDTGREQTRRVLQTSEQDRFVEQARVLDRQVETAKSFDLEM